MCIENEYGQDTQMETKKEKFLHQKPHRLVQYTVHNLIQSRMGDRQVEPTTCNDIEH